MTQSDLDRLRAQALTDPSVPEPVRAALLRGAALEEIRLDATGRWWHQGEPFIHRGLQRLFYRNLHQSDGGTWLITLPPYSYPVIVEGCGRFIIRIRDRGTHVEATELDERRVLSTWDTLWTDGEDVVGLALDGQPARCIGAAHATLLADVDVEDQGEWVLRRKGQTYPFTLRPRSLASPQSARGAG